MNPSIAAVIVPPLPTRETKASLLRVICATALITWLGDFLFWNSAPGVSVGIFAIALAIILLLLNATRSWTWATAVGALLLVGASVQAAIELCFTNVTVLVVLILSLVGECHFAQLPRGWARLFESAVAFLGSPGRWIWLSRAVKETPLTGLQPGGVTISRLLRIVMPAIMLALVFGLVLASGNAVLSELGGRAITRLRDWLLRIDFSIWRFCFWLLSATLALAALRPRAASAQRRFWVHEPGLWQRSDVLVAFWQSAAVLLMLNALFFIVNTIDVVYLWQRASLPTGVEPRTYLHEGVHSISAAAVLSAIVLSLLFQQGPAVTQSRALKTLAHLWTIQNFVLIAGVFLRLKLFVDVSLLTEKRIYVGCFLLLVATGFIFLTVHVERGAQLGRVLWRNAVATFVLFYVIQFVDVVGIAARSNVARWEKGWPFDVHYHAGLSASAWPVLLRVARDTRRSQDAAEARKELRRIVGEEQTRAGRSDWRSWQARRAQHARRVLDEIDSLPVL